MNHYLDIEVLPDLEFSETLLINALYAKLHRALAQQKQAHIGVSFPNHKKHLGDKVRLHGSDDDLNKLMSTDWLKGLRDYTHKTASRPVPESAKYRTVKRVQVKSAHNKRKRSVSKGWLTVEQAFEKIPDNQQKQLSLPFAQFKSLSTDNIMRIYVEHGELMDTPSDGVFSSYGLSTKSTIPWF